MFLDKNIADIVELAETYQPVSCPKPLSCQTVRLNEALFPAAAAKAAAGRCSSVAAQCSFTQLEREGFPDFIHGLCHFIKWDRMIYTGQGQLGTCERIRHADGVSGLAWTFHKACDRVADQPKQVGDGQTCGLQPASAPATEAFRIKR